MAEYEAIGGEVVQYVRSLRLSVSPILSAMASTRALFLLLGLSSCLAFSPASLPGLRQSARSSVSMKAEQNADNQDLSRRSAVQLGLASTAIIKSQAANAKEAPKPFAPMITIFDSRGCRRENTEYTGKKCGGEEDEMLVKVMMQDFTDRYGDWEVEKFAEQRKSYYGWKYQDLIKTGYNGLYKVADS